MESLLQIKWFDDSFLFGVHLTGMETVHRLSEAKLKSCINTQWHFSPFSFYSSCCPLKIWNHFWKYPDHLWKMFGMQEYVFSLQDKGLDPNLKSLLRREKCSAFLWERRKIHFPNLYIKLGFMKEVKFFCQFCTWWTL